ncbi:MAG: hypothetical protein AAGA56_22705 [Myxococcota bacterium]
MKVRRSAVSLLLVVSGVCACGPHIRTIPTQKLPAKASSCPVEQLDMTLAEAFETEKWDLVGSIEVLSGWSEVQRDGPHVEDDLPQRVCRMGGSAFVFKATDHTEDRWKVTYAVLRPKPAVE